MISHYSYKDISAHASLISHYVYKDSPFPFWSVTSTASEPDCLPPVPLIAAAYKSHIFLPSLAHYCAHYCAHHQFRLLIPLHRLIQVPLRPKMTVTFKGLDCIADINTTAYADQAALSQTGKHTMSYQANYSYFFVCYCSVLIFLTMVKYVSYLLDDRLYRSAGRSMPRWCKRVLALCRYCSYRRLPSRVSKLTGLPNSLGTLLVLCATSAFVLCVCFIPHFYYRGCRDFGTPPLAGRAGSIVMSLTPFLILISGKTNLVSFITGVSYEKLTVFHHALSWGSLFFALVHMVPLLLQPTKEGGVARLKELWFGEDNKFYTNGTVAIVLLFCICLFSTRAFKFIGYEIWWHSHWILGLTYFAILTWHVYGLSNLQRYMWATLAFGGVQMLYRVLTKSTFKPNKYILKAKHAALNRISAGCYDVVVNVESTKELNWAPGQHIFIRFVLGIHTLDNHPFSVISVPESTDVFDLRLIVRPRRGLTRRLYGMIDEKSSGLNCYIDGPYGGMCRDPLSFDKLVLMSTGTGVAVTLPFIQFVAQHMNDNSCQVREIEFIWVVRSKETISWVQSELRRAMETLQGMLTVNIYVTNSHRRTRFESISSKMVELESESSLEGLSESSSESSLESSSDSSSTKIMMKDQTDPELLNIYTNCKPKIRGLLSNMSLKTKNAVICAGSASFQVKCANSCARLQTRVLKGECEEIYLHTETFGW